jgi:hypothetical protein
MPHGMAMMQHLDNMKKFSEQSQSLLFKSSKKIETTQIWTICHHPRRLVVLSLENMVDVLDLNDLTETLLKQERRHTVRASPKTSMS